MSSSSAENGSVREDELENDALVMDHGGDIPEAMAENGEDTGGRIVEILAEERAGTSSPLAHENGINGRGYRNAQKNDDASAALFPEPISQRPASPMESEASFPDDTPSVQVPHSYPTVKSALLIYYSRVQLCLPQVAVFFHQ